MRIACHRLRNGKDLYSSIFESASIQGGSERWSRRAIKQDRFRQPPSTIGQRRALLHTDNASELLGVPGYGTANKSGAPSLKSVVREQGATTTCEDGQDKKKIRSIARPQTEEDLRNLFSRPVNWRERLRSVEDYIRETDYERQLSPGPRLVDEPALQSDWQLWRELLRFAVRQYGDEGVQKFWKEVRSRNLVLPTSGAVADEIWKTLLQVAVQQDLLLQDVVTYATAIRKTHGSYWHQLYASIVLSKIEHNPDLAVSWHQQLQEHFPPAARDYEAIFEECLQRDIALRHFATVYATKPIPRMYIFVVSRLCESQRFEDAFGWHFKLLAARDFPRNSSALVPLLTHFVSIRDHIPLAKLITSVSEHGLLAREQLEKIVRKSRVSGAPHKRQGYSDEFCARLFATSMFGVGSVIQGLKFLKVTTLGPSSLREIVSREACDCIVICGHLDHLKSVGIQLPTSKYCTLIRHAAIGNKSWLLESIIDSDIHPEAYEDLNLQERLLAMYLAKKDQTQVDRTLAIMMLEVPQASLEMQHLNFLFRANLTLGRMEDTFALLRQMSTSNVPLTPKSSRHVRVHFIERRRGGRLRLSELKRSRLRLVIGIMKETMKTAGHGAFPADAWREILRRLGSNGLLLECQRLALWLANEYSGFPMIQHLSRSQPTRDATLIEEPSSNTSGKVWALNPVFNDNLALERARMLSQNKLPIKPPHYKHPIARLFPEVAQRAIIAWGFKFGVKPGMRAPGRSSLKPTRPDWTWGLKLLCRLRSMGVPVSHRTVNYNSRQRLAWMFKFPSKFKLALDKLCGSRLDRHLAARRRRKIHDNYLQHLTKVWGGNLFVNRSANRPQGRRRRCPRLRPSSESLSGLITPWTLPTQKPTGKQRYPAT